MAASRDDTDTRLHVYIPLWRKTSTHGVCFAYNKDLSLLTALASLSPQLRHDQNQYWNCYPLAKKHVTRVITLSNFRGTNLFFHILGIVLSVDIARRSITLDRESGVADLSRQTKFQVKQARLANILDFCTRLADYRRFIACI